MILWKILTHVNFKKRFLKKMDKDIMSSSGTFRLEKQA